jgi:hypothetical protein
MTQGAPVDGAPVVLVALATAEVLVGCAVLMVTTYQSNRGVPSIFVFVHTEGVFCGHTTPFGFCMKYESAKPLRCISAGCCLVGYATLCSLLGCAGPLCDAVWPSQHRTIG